MQQLRNILLVEDEEIIALMVESALAKAGYKVLACDNAQDGLAIAETHALALLIADVHLPGSMDGMALARKLRRLSPHLPMILMSGSYDDSQTFHEGLNAFLLSKPFRKAHLLNKVQQALAGSC